MHLPLLHQGSGLRGWDRSSQLCPHSAPSSTDSGKRRLASVSDARKRAESCGFQKDQRPLNNSRWQFCFRKILKLSHLSTKRGQYVAVWQFPEEKKHIDRLKISYLPGESGWMEFGQEVERVAQKNRLNLAHQLDSGNNNKNISSTLATTKNISSTLATKEAKLSRIFKS